MTCDLTTGPFRDEASEDGLLFSSEEWDLLPTVKSPSRPEREKKKEQEEKEKDASWRRYCQELSSSELRAIFEAPSGRYSVRLKKACEEEYHRRHYLTIKGRADQKWFAQRGLSVEDCTQDLAVRELTNGEKPSRIDGDLRKAEQALRTRRAKGILADQSNYAKLRPKSLDAPLMNQDGEVRSLGDMLPCTEDCFSGICDEDKTFVARMLDLLSEKSKKLAAVMQLKIMEPDMTDVQIAEQLGLVKEVIKAASDNSRSLNETERLVLGPRCVALKPEQISSIEALLDLEEGTFRTMSDREQMKVLQRVECAKETARNTVNKRYKRACETCKKLAQAGKLDFD